jgi:hypothetical protein
VLTVVDAPVAPRAQTATRRPRRRRLSVLTLLQAVAVGSLSAFLVAHVWAARYVRYVADDYAMVNLLRDHGFLGGQVSWYQSWSGRFSATAADLGAAWLGPGWARLVPAALLVLWLAALIWAILQIGRAAGVRLPRLSAVLLAELVLFATLVSIPDVFESVYWMTGALTYSAPLVLGTVLLGVLARAVADPGRRRGVMAIAAGGLAWGAGGFDDSYVSAQTVAIGIALLLALRGVAPRLRALRLTLAAALGGSLLALVLVAFAPGNAVREAYFPPHPGLAWVTSWSVTQATWLAVHTWMHLAVAVGALSTAAVVGVVALRAGGATVPRPGRRHALGLLVVAPLIVMAAVAPAYWGMSQPPPPRALLVPIYVLVLAAVAGGALLGLAVAGAVRGREDVGRWSGRGGVWQRGAVALPLVALILAPVPAAVSIAGHLGAMSTYAEAKDAQAAALVAAKRAGTTAPTVEAAPTQGLGVLSYDRAEEMARDPRCWVNRAVASDYGLGTVTVTGRAAASSC